MSETYFFPDNTVMINFAIANRLDLLRVYLTDHGRVTAAVLREIRTSAGMVPHLNSVDTESWFGAGIDVTSDADIRAVENIRTNRFGGARNDSLKHLGESQTLHVMSSTPEFGSSKFLTDDSDAYRIAEKFGIVRRHTVEIFRELVAFREISAQDAFEAIVSIRESKYDRHLLEHPTSARNLG